MGHSMGRANVNHNPRSHLTQHIVTEWVHIQEHRAVHMSIIRM